MQVGEKNWLPHGFLFPDGSKSKKLLVSGDNWQIITTNMESFVIITAPALRERWVAGGLIGENLFTDIEAPHGIFSVFIGKHDYMLSSVQYGPYSTYSLLLYGHREKAALPTPEP